jgi:nitrogen fixation/metabolism regulation signal transduction histidine kinase
LRLRQIFLVPSSILYLLLSCCEQPDLEHASAAIATATVAWERPGPALQQKNSSPQPFENRMKSLLYRPVQLAALMFLGLLLVALGVMGILTWRNLERLDYISTAVDHIFSIQSAGLQIQQVLQRDLAGEAPVDDRDLHQVGQGLASVLSPEKNLSPSSARKLREVVELLTAQASQPREALAKADGLMSEALQEQTRAEAQFLEAIDDYALTEMKLAAALLILFPGFSLAAIWLLRERIFRPINNLKELLLRITNGDFAPVNMAQIDPLLSPLFNNYNQMVVRLEKLEQVHRRHAATLENEVRAATEALLQQQQSLARAERLAAVGELSAAVAHELRNPLAGIQMALSNLRQELKDAGLMERLDLVINEVQRITRMLNDLVAQSRQAPEVKRLVKLAPLVRELLALTRYQTPPQIVLRDRVPDDLECRLPADGLRQALLNLVLNAIQSLRNRTGTVTVSARKERKFLHITVCDDGTGFPDALLSGGVRPFATGHESGTGLGLAIVQRFAREAEGELRLSNREPHGACAELMLSCDKQDG